MRTLCEPAQSGVTAGTRVLFLPAAYTGPEDFVRAGFVRAVRERQLPLDLVFADLNLQHLTDRTILRRVRHELVLPARALGCRSIWICGISLGGFIGLAYAERYTSEIDGLCVLAPYLGNYMTTGEIERAGGVAAWKPGGLADDDDERRVWRFIKSWVDPPLVKSRVDPELAESWADPPLPKSLVDSALVKSQVSPPLPVHLGYGREDRFAGSHRMMAEALHPDDVQVIPGGHEWPVWSQLWEGFLDRQHIRQDRDLQPSAAASNR